MSEQGLFDGLLAAGPVAEQVDDPAWLQAMLDFEAGLAWACSDVALIPASVASAIQKCCDAGAYEIAELAASAVQIGNPAGPMVRALTAKVDPDAAGYVHLGATSQDVIDTATMLVAVRALRALNEDLDVCARILAVLAETHGGTVMSGRTLLQNGPPVTFGLTAAAWLNGIAAAQQRLEDITRHRLAVQFGGAVGTLAALDGNGVAVMSALARRLDLAEPELPWHTERGRVAELAAALGQTCGAVAKTARDIVLLAQTEVAEVAERGPSGTGGSSSMPHKHNQVAAILAAAAAEQAPGLVASVFGAAAQEHQRAAGSWHAEWRPLRELLRTTGSAVHWLGASLTRLQPDPHRMRANLDASGGLTLAEKVVMDVMSASDGAVGRQGAADAVAECCRAAESGAGTLIDLLAADELIGKYLNRNRIEAVLDPNHYLGSTHEWIARVLRSWRARR